MCLLHSCLVRPFSSERAKENGRVVEYVFGGVSENGCLVEVHVIHGCSDICTDNSQGIPSPGILRFLFKFATQSHCKDGALFNRDLGRDRGKRWDAEEPSLRGSAELPECKVVFHCQEIKTEEARQ